MKVCDLFSDWRKEDGVSLKVSEIKPKLINLSVIATFVLMAGTVQAHDNVTKSPTLETLISAVNQHKIQYSAESFSSGENLTKAFLNDRDVATECRISLNHSHPDITRLHMSDTERIEYAYYHEQAHCADYANLFHGVDAYKKDEKLTKTLKGDALISQLEAILNEGFADTFALLKMSARHPEKADLYFNEVYQFRVMEEQRATQGQTMNDHDTRAAINAAAKAWNRLDIEKVRDLSRTPAGNAQLEQSLATFASKAASEGLRVWMTNHQFDTNVLSDGSVHIEQMVKQSSLNRTISAQDTIQDWRNKRATPTSNNTMK